MTTQDIVLCSPVRTAIGAYNGSLKTIRAPDLGAAVVRETLRRSGLDAASIGRPKPILKRRRSATARIVKP
jgi:acetyl-CoA C-acetyltransferase